MFSNSWRKLTKSLRQEGKEDKTERETTKGDSEGLAKRRFAWSTFATFSQAFFYKLSSVISLLFRLERK